MVKNLTTEEIHRFIVDDFSGAWDSVAANSNQGIGRGNFMFASQAMSLLEFAARVYSYDTSKNLHRNFSTNLYKIEPKYFTLFPAACAMTTEFTLPHDGDTTGRTLLWALFDLVRNGLAHQYQQIIVDLNDGKHFSISLTGANLGQYLNTVKKSHMHPAYTFDHDGDLELKIYPQILFLDFEDAIRKSNLLNKRHPFQYLSRPKSKSGHTQKGVGSYYNFDTIALEKSLVACNHMKF
jgi:hypothetical protein